MQGVAEPHLIFLQEVLFKVLVVLAVEVVVNRVQMVQQELQILVVVEAADHLMVVLLDILVEQVDQESYLQKN
jgi:hypothetical protein